MKKLIFGVLIVLVIVSIGVQIKRARPEQFCPTLTGECPEYIKK